MTRNSMSTQPQRVSASRPASPVHRELPEIERRKLAGLLQRLGQQAVAAALGAAPTAVRSEPVGPGARVGEPREGSSAAEPVMIEATLRVIAAAADGATAVFEVAVPSSCGGAGVESRAFLPEEDDAVATTRMLLRLGANGF